MNNHNFFFGQRRVIQLVRYIKEVRINDHVDMTHGLVDTGSAVSIVKKSTAEKLDLVYH